MLAEGIGDVLTELPDLPETPVVLVKPGISVPTPWVYKNLNLENILHRPDTDRLIECIKEYQVDGLARDMVNVLETVTACKYKEINTIKKRLLDLGAAGSMMSGSGPSVFGIFQSMGNAERAFEIIKHDFKECYLTETIGRER